MCDSFSCIVGISYTETDEVIKRNISLLDGLSVFGNPFGTLDVRTYGRIKARMKVKRIAGNANNLTLCIALKTGSETPFST